MMLDLRQIQYFACLFEQRSVTRAARSLGVVQPALSMQISRLEKRLGLRLFQRTARYLRHRPPKPCTGYICQCCSISSTPISRSWN